MDDGKPTEGTRGSRPDPAGPTGATDPAGPTATTGPAGPAQQTGPEPPAAEDAAAGPTVPDAPVPPTPTTPPAPAAPPVPPMPSAPAAGATAPVASTAAAGAPTEPGHSSGAAGPAGAAERAEAAVPTGTTEPERGAEPESAAGPAGAAGPAQTSVRATAASVAPEDAAGTAGPVRAAAPAEAAVAVAPEDSAAPSAPARDTGSTQGTQPADATGAAEERNPAIAAPPAGAAARPAHGSGPAGTESPREAGPAEAGRSAGTGSVEAGHPAGTGPADLRKGPDGGGDGQASPGALPGGVPDAPSGGGDRPVHRAPQGADALPATPASATAPQPPEPPSEPPEPPSAPASTAVPTPVATSMHSHGPGPEARTPEARSDAAAADPWRNYDPWAAPAPAPLPQSGAGQGAGAKTARLVPRGRKALVAAGLGIALLSGAVGGAVGVHLERSGAFADVVLPQAAPESTERDPDSVAGIAARALPSVVTLHVRGAREGGTGTGFVLDERGHILTNDHVVRPAGPNGEITVTFHNGDTARATLVGGDIGYDLAVVRVTRVAGLTPLPLGNSDSVQVGDPVVAIGAPYELSGTVTAGIISAKERPITAGGERGDGSDVSYVDALQTDAPINPGNSGGPLLDARGRVIGINSAIRSADGRTDERGKAGSIGLGFAIPVNQAKRVAEELIDTGRATHPVIGITLDMDYAGDGARVSAQGGDGGPAVVKGGPGDRAGIRPGDVITEVNGQRVHSGEELIVKTRAHRPGDRLELTVERDGEERTISLVLGSSGGR